MLTITFAQLQGWMVLFLWPFFRLTAFMLTAPLLGHSAIPRTVKIGLAALITFVIAPNLPPMPNVPIWSWPGLGVIVEQIVIGAALGLVLHVMFSAVLAAGDFIGLQMGLAFATFVMPGTGTNTMILSRFFYLIALLMFLAMNGHLMVIETLAFSFNALPIGYTGLNAGAFNLLAHFGATIFSAGLLLALPLIAALLIVNLGLGILNRAAPQMTVFSVGFPTSLLLGLFLVSVLMTHLGRYLDALFGQGLQAMHALIQAMAPV